MKAERAKLHPLPSSMAQAYQYAMLGEIEPFAQELKRLTLRTDMGYQEKEAHAFNMGGLMEHLEAEKALSPEILAAITESEIVHIDFRVIVRRIIADRLIVDNDHEGFVSLMTWYKTYVEKHQFKESCTFLHDDYAHINLMCEKYLDDPEMLATFSSLIPLNPPTAKSLIERGNIPGEAVIAAMRLHKYLYPIQDSILLQQIHSTLKSRPKQTCNIQIADVWRYLGFIGDIAYNKNINRVDLAVIALDQVLNNPLALHSSFNIDSLTSYRFIFSPETKPLFDVIVKNEERIIEIIHAHILDDKKNPQLMHAVSDMSIKKIGTDKLCGLREVHRDTILHLAENGMKKLAILASSMSAHVIQNHDHLQELSKHCGPLTMDQFVDIYMASVARTDSSMADIGVTYLTTFLKYAHNQGWDMPWRESYEKKGIGIVSAGIQLNNLQSYIKETEANGKSTEWPIRQLNNALISMDKLMGTKYGFDLKATAEANLDRDILMQLSHYKRLCLSEDLNL
jgi:hypothetical protein